MAWRKSSGRVSLAFNRRDFLRTSIAVPAAAGAGYFAWQRLKGGPVRTVIVGTGKQGREALIRQSPPGHIDYVGFYDIRPTQIEAAKREFVGLYGIEKAKKIKAYGDFKEILSDRNVDAVVIATPTHVHARLAMDALKAGKHVYVEAPMADNVLDAKAITRYAQQQQLVLAVGHQRAGSSRYQEAIESVKGGTLGDVRYIETFNQFNASESDPWRPAIPDADKNATLVRGDYGRLEELVQWRLFKRSGGMAAEVASHHVDALRVMLGDKNAYPLAVSGVADKYLFKDAREVEDHLYLRFEMPNELVVTFAGAMSTGAEGHGEMILGTRGSLLFVDEQDLQVSSPPVPAPPGGTKPAGDAKSIKVAVENSTKGAPTMYSAASVGYTAAAASSKPKVSVGFTESLQKFAAAVRQKAPHVVACSGEQGLQVLVTALAARKAATERKRIVFEADWLKPESAAIPDEKPQDLSLAKTAGLAT